MPSDRRPNDQRTNTYDPTEQNTARTMPVVFLLDATGSMLHTVENGRTRMDVLNHVVEQFLCYIVKDVRARNATEVAFVVFTNEILLKTEFFRIHALDKKAFETNHREYRGCVKVHEMHVKDKSNFTHSIQIPRFAVSKHDNGTKIGAAVLLGLEMLTERRRQNAGFGSYVPFLILMTDGHPDGAYGDGYQDERQEEAMDALHSACTNFHLDQMVVPFIIGVGGDDINTQTLRGYSSGFDGGYLHIYDEISDAATQIICDLICKSLTKSFTPQKIMLQKDIQKAQEQIHKTRDQNRGLIEI